MAKSHILVLPEQELAALQSAAQTPQFAHLLRQLPAFAVALGNPLPDNIAYIAENGNDAARDAQANTSYPEDWSEFREDAQTLIKALRELGKLQKAAVAGHTPPAQDGCPCCGGRRWVYFMAKSGWKNGLTLRHLDFSTGCWMPLGFGIPGESAGTVAGQDDGPRLEVCLDCGRLVNGEFPLSDEVLKKRIAQWRKNDLSFAPYYGEDQA